MADLTHDETIVLGYLWLRETGDLYGVRESLIERGLLIAEAVGATLITPAGRKALEEVEKP